MSSSSSSLCFCFCFETVTAPPDFFDLDRGDDASAACAECGDTLELAVEFELELLEAAARDRLRVL